MVGQIDDGKEIINLGEQLMGHDVRSIRIATLVHRDKIPMDDLYVEFVGFTVRTKKKLVGWGIGTNGNCRYLPHVYAVAKEQYG